MATKKKSSKKPAKKSAPKKQKQKQKPQKKTGKAAAKRATPKKSVTKKAAQKKVTPKKAKVETKPFKRRDATGHLDPNYERGLRRDSNENKEHDDDRGFLVGKNADDALAQELGREFVETVTSGEDEGNELRDELVTEELGGPFVPSTDGKEMAEDTDESNPADATREPFPKV